MWEILATRIQLCFLINFLKKYSKTSQVSFRQYRRMESRCGFPSYDEYFFLTYYTCYTHFNSYKYNSWCLSYYIYLRVYKVQYWNWNKSNYVVYDLYLTTLGYTLFKLEKKKMWKNRHFLGSFMRKSFISIRCFFFADGYKRFIIR